MPAPPVQQKQPTTVAGPASVFDPRPKQGPNSTPGESTQTPKIRGMTDDLFKQISNACKSLSTVANLLQQNAMVEKASVSLNKSRSIRTTFDEKNESRRVLNTKTVNVTMGVNNDSTAIFMSGAKLPFNQFLGGRNAYATLNVITNDPEVVVDIMSMFHGSTVYEAINNMMQQARGLLKTRAPFNPSSGVFKRYLDRGAQQIFPDESIRALRVLRAQIKADQFINIVSQSVKQLTGKIDDLFFTQEEPLILYHPLMNSLGYKSFYPVKADLKSVEGSPGYISIVLTLQWIDSKLFMKEAIRHRKSSTDSLGYKGLAWYNSFADTDVAEEKDKENREARKKRDRRTGSLVQDIINDRNSSQKKSSEARRYGKDMRYILSSMATSLSSGPPLMAYAIARHLEYIESIRAVTQERIKQNPSLLLDTTEGQVAREELASELRASGLYTPHLITAPTSSRDSDAIGSLGRFGVTLGTAVAAGGLDRIPIGHKALAGLAAKSHVSETASIVKRLGGRIANPTAGALRGLKAGGLFTIVDILAGATVNGFQLNAYQKAAAAALDIQYIALKTTDSRAIDFNTIPVFEKHIERIIDDTIFRSKGGNGYPLLFNLNIPFLMASYYIDFIIRILEIYDRPDTIEAHIKTWTTKALRAFETRLAIPENQNEANYFGYTVKGLSNGSTNGGFYGYTTSNSLNDSKDSLPDYCFLITTGIDGSPDAMNEDPEIGSGAGGVLGKLLSSKQTVNDLDNKFEEAYKKFTERGYKEDNPKELAKIFMDRLGATSINIIRSIRDLNIRTIELYLKQMDGFSCAGYAYACFSLISLNRLYGLANLLPDLETNVNPNYVLRKLRNFNEEGPQLNTTDIQDYNYTLQSYANTLKKYRNDIRKKVGRRLSSLPEQTKSKIIKRARTLMAYGNNYRKYDSVEREVNTAMFEFMRAYTIDFLLGAKRYYETDMVVPTQIRENGTLSVVETTNSDHLSENPYYIYFVQPYTFGESYNWGKALTDAISERGGLGTLVLEAVATTVLAVVIGALFGLEAVAAGIIAAIVYLIITSAESLINWSYNFISNALTTADSESEKIGDLLKNAPLAFLGQGIIYRLIEQLPEDSLLFHSNNIYPPEVNTENSVSNIVDPDTYMALPLRYYRSIRRTAFPGFWIWSEKTKDVQKLTEEFKLQTAIIESNRYSLGSITGRGIEAIVKAQNNINPAEQIFVRNGPAISIISNIMEFAFFYTLIESIINKRAQGKKVDDYYRDPEFIVGVKQGATTGFISSESLIKKATDLCGKIFYGGFYRKGASAARGPFDFDYRIDTDPIPNQVGLDVSVPTYSRRSANDNFSYVSSYGVVFTKTINLKALKIPRLEADLNNFTSRFIENNKLTPWVIYDQYQDIFTLQMFSGAVRPTYYNNPGKNRDTADNKTTDRVKQDFKSGLDVTQNELTAVVTNPDGYQDVTSSARLFAKALISTSNSNEYAILANRFKESTRWITSNDIVRNSFAYKDEAVQGSFKEILEAVIDQREYRAAQRQYTRDSRKIENLTTLTRLLQNTAGAYGEAGFAVTKNSMSQLLDEASRYNFGEKTSKSNPVYKIYFLQDNLREWLLMDDYYSYSGVESIAVTGSKNSPIATASLKLTNFTNKLSNVMADRLYRENPLLQDPSIQADVSSILLKPGCHLKIYLGYGSVLTEEDCVFCGEITDMKGDQIKEITCMSFGTLLMEPLGVPSPIEIKVSTDDLDFQRNPYSILELLLKKVLVKNFLKTVTNVTGRLGESSVLVGSSGFDVDTVDPHTKGIFNEFKDNISVPVLYKGLTRILGTTFLGGRVDVDAVGRFAGDAFNERYVSNNIIENVRVWHTPVNDTNYNVFNKREATDEFISNVNNSVLRPILEDGNIPDIFSGLQEEISELIQRDATDLSVENNTPPTPTNEKIKRIAYLLTLIQPGAAPFAAGFLAFDDETKKLLKEIGLAAAEKAGNTISDTSEKISRGYEAFKKTIHEIGSSIKRPFTGDGIFNESHVAYNMTYWSYIQDVLLQMPNHVCVVRPFGERNTLVITDRLRGYYRYNRKHLTSEAKTVNIIRLLEEFKGLDIDTLAIVMDSMLKPTEDSLAMFILWYTFTARALSMYQANTAGRIFYQIPDKEQIQHVVACLNFIMNEAARIKRLQEVGTAIARQAILNSDDNDYLNTYLNDQKTAENIRRTNQIEEDFAKNGTADLEEIRAQIVKCGVNLPTDSVGARKFLMASLFPSTKNILHPGLTNASFAAVMVAKVASLGLYIDVVGADKEKANQELSEERYNQFAAAEAVRQGAAEVINWSIAQAYQRSSSHRKITDLHYKETEVDIIDNSINLMKGFNAVNAFFLKEPELVKDIPTTTDNSIFEEEGVIPVSPNLKWLNTYQTFILNGPAADSNNPIKARGSMISQVLSNLVQDYYGGSITFVGDSRIKEWDQIYVSDHMKDMFGLIQVSDYTHLYDKQNGFVTVVTPALPAFNDYATSSGPDIPWQWSLYGSLLSGIKYAAMGTALFFGGRKLLRAFANRPAFMRIKLSVQSAAKFIGLPAAVTAKAANAFKKVAGFAAWGEREFLGTNRIAQRITNFEQMQQVMTKSLDRVSISKLANTSAIDNQIGKVYNIINSEGRIVNTEACKLREFATGVKTKIDDLLGKVSDRTENFSAELKKSILQSHPSGKAVEDRIIAKVQDAIKQRLKTVNDLNVAVVDSAEIVERLGPTATPEKIFQALTDAMTLRVSKLGSVVKEDEIRSIVKTTINEEVASLRKEFDTLIANIPENLEEAATLRASLKADSDEIIKLLTDTVEDVGTQGATAGSNSILKSIQTQIANLERKPAKDELLKNLLNVYEETLFGFRGSELLSSPEVRRQIAMNVVDAYIVNIKSGAAFLKDLIGGNIMEGGMAAIFGSFSGKGAIGALGAYGVYSTFKEFIWDPTNDAYTALLTNLAGQNAVTISGLYSKGEPFVANLDGMEKRATQVLSEGGPLLAYRARLGRNFDAFSDTFGAGFRDAYSELVGTTQDLIRADNEIVVNPDPEPTEVGAPGSLFSTDRPTEPFNTPR